MMVLDEIRRRARLITGPVLGITLVGYFAYHLFAGDRGLIAWAHLTQDLRDAKATLAAIESEKQTLDRRVSLLRPDHLDRDMLDERAREVLNLAGPDEIVILNPPGTPAARR